MRLHACYMTGALIATAIPPSAGAQPTQASGQTAAEQTMLAQDVCRPGGIWEPAGYLRSGK